MPFKDRTNELTFDDQTLKDIYAKAVEEPNRNYLRKGFIKCPECGEEILMIPTLRIMSQAIETHVHVHKEQLKEEPIKEHTKAITIRLTLMGQVLKQAVKMQAS
jgi:hypothetical protein